jgi:23S rRNA pseudouridine955/2504/2580 synthase
MQAALITIPAEFTDMRLDRFVRGQYKGVTQGWIEKNMRKGLIRLDGKKARANMRITEGQTLTLPELPDLDQPAPKQSLPADHKLVKAIRAAVIEEGTDWIAINKPPGIASQGGSKIIWSIDSLAAALVPADETTAPKLVHRLDKDTSGIMLLAKTAAAARRLTDGFKHKTMQKTYLAITLGVPQNAEGRFTQRLLKQPTPHGGEMVQVDPNGQSAVTDYAVVDTLGKRYALVALSPRTGRTHQLRVHLAHNGTPIVGDPKYGGEEIIEDNLPPGLMLHAWQLQWPELKTPLTAPPPPAFLSALEILGLHLPSQNPFEGLE